MVGELSWVTPAFRNKKRDSNKKDGEGVARQGGEKHIREMHIISSVKKNSKNVIKFIEYYWDTQEDKDWELIIKWERVITVDLENSEWWWQDSWSRTKYELMK